jgi:hypothetical protein
MVVPSVRGSWSVGDAYAVLGLARGATEAQVRAAWRDAARRTHPDVGGDAVAFRRAREAYEILIDPVRRAAHDRLLDARSAGRPTDPPPPRTAPYRTTDASVPRTSRAASRPTSRGTSRGTFGRAFGGTFGRREWVLLAANVLVVLRAIDILRGNGASTPSRGTFLYPLPAGGLELWLVSMDLLGLPWLFLVLAAGATALLAAELVHERTERTPLLDAQQRSTARLVQTALPAPLALAAVLTAVAAVVQLVVAVLLLVAFLYALWVVLGFILSD